MSRRVSRCLLACTAVLACAAADHPDSGPSRAHLPEPGPSRGDLALRLIVDNPDGGEGTWTLRVDLINRGEEAIALVASYFYEGEGDFDGWLRESIGFSVVPEVRHDGYQTAGAFRERPQPTRHLAPGETLTLTWDIDRPSFARHGGALHLRRPGRHLIRAHAALTTVGGEGILLYSNEQAFQVGPDPVAPAASVARVLHGQRPEGTVALDRGSLHGVAIGDVFAVRQFPDGSWRLRVSEVEPGHAVAEVVTVSKNQGPARTLGPTPPADAEAAYVGDGDDGDDDE